MNYTEIKDTALKYSMRTDQDTADQVDNFMRMVEARLDRALNIQMLMSRAVLGLAEGTNYYAPPAGMLSIRDIQINHDGGDTGTPVYVNPETMNDCISNGSQELIYTLIDGQIQIHPVRHLDQLEVVYMKRVPALSPFEPTNAISDNASDIYLYGILVEISAYSKDYEASQMWDQRFTGAVNDLQAEDDVSRWSGTPLRIRTA